MPRSGSGCGIIHKLLPLCSFNQDLSRTNCEIDKKAEQQLMFLSAFATGWQKLSELLRDTWHDGSPKLSGGWSPAPGRPQWGFAWNRGNMSEEQQRCSRASALRHLANLITDEDRLLQPPSPPLYLASGVLPAAPPPRRKKKKSAQADLDEEGRAWQTAAASSGEQLKGD